jgi:hypothetical protein
VKKFILHHNGTIIAIELENFVSVIANPTDPAGNDMVGYDDVFDSDASDVALLQGGASIIIANTVYVGKKWWNVMRNRSSW